MSQLGKLLAVLAALAILPGSSSAQIHPAGSRSVDGRVYVKVYVTLPNASIRYNPMQDVAVVIYRSRGDSLVIRTDGAGETTFLLESGSYRVVTGEAVTANGVHYQWDMPIDVYPGMAAVDLNPRNAIVAGQGASRQLAEQSPPRQVPPSASSAPVNQTLLVYPPKSGATAFVLSFLITGGGQVYAGETGSGVALFLVDLGGAALMINGLQECGGYYSGCNDGKIGVGAALVLGSWIYSMVDAPAAAGRYNRKHAFAQPVLGLGPRGSAQVGMRLQLGK
jgi:TM2 domain.